MTDAEQPIAESTVTMTLPNGKRLRIAVEVMSDLECHSRAELLPEPVDDGG